MENELKLSAKYCYNYLNLHSGGSSVDRLGNTLYQSKIQLTPHQINAALFAFQSPFSKGSILADEVGLGKTIEAGIVITQYIYERKNRVLIVTPASLQRQWENELYEKFGLDTLVIDRKIYNKLKKSGHTNPFDAPKKVLICSYQMCSLCKEDVEKVGFNLVVIDEAHKLRNVHGSKAITSKNILSATKNSKKLLLTATPIQNSLLDLYGLSQFIDPNIFADKTLFKKNYINDFVANESELNERIHTFLHRTLRSQVNKYIKFTNRIPKTFSFHQTEEESKVYNAIRNLLLNAENNIYIIPAKQRHLLLLILGKLMGSSMHAIVFTLNKIIDRLEKVKSTGYVDDADETLMDLIEEDLEEEILDEEIEKESVKIDIDEINREIQLLQSIVRDAINVKVESKYIALQNALLYSFQHLNELGAEEKVVIFTESRRTQEYLCKALRKDGYEGVISYNGTNTDNESKKIYEEWCENPNNIEFLGRSKSINIKSAILEKFKTDGKILVTTEAGAEGLNMQFCSLVINYDLPWNPQRVEQRIGRCHRFGQLFDVVVINFISVDNVVEQRIYELLDTKFSLFTEVLGSSDTVLGALEKGEDLAQSIIEIYTKCRSNEEINEAFDELQEKYKDDIESSIQKTKQTLMDNFDEDLQQLFSTMMDSVNESVGEIEKLFWRLTKCILNKKAQFNDKNYTFAFLDDNKKYSLNKDCSNDEIFYGLNSELGKEILDYAKRIKETYGYIEFDKSNYPFKVGALNNLLGKHGYIIVKKLTLQAVEQEEYMVVNGILDDGTRLDEDICKKLFRLNTVEKIYTNSVESDLINDLFEDVKININRIKQSSIDSNNENLQKEIDRINKWADDKIQAIQISVENMREERKLLQKESEMASNFIEKKEIEEKILTLSKKIKQSWLTLASSEDDIEEERRKMISNIKNIDYGKQEEELLLLVEFKVI